MSAGKLIYILACIEGSNLLAFEIVSSRLYTPYLGSGIAIWTAILSITLLALALGYRSGAKVELLKIKQRLILSFLVSSILILASPYIAKIILPKTYGISTQSSAILSGFVILFVPIFFMGQIAPLLTQLRPKDQHGKVSGIIYGLGTMAGVLMTLASVFYMIPYIGVRLTISCIGAFQLLGALLIVFKKVEHA